MPPWASGRPTRIHYDRIREEPAEAFLGLAAVRIQRKTKITTAKGCVEGLKTLSLG